MSPLQEAIDLIDRVVADFRGNRQDHVNIQQAMSIIRSEVFKPAPVEPDKPAESAQD